MSTNSTRIDPLPRPVTDPDIHALAKLHIDAVESGAAVSFVLPFPIDQAEAWWRTSLTALHPRAVCLVARDSQGIAGTVQLQPAWAPNQPHRAEVAKLMVHRRCRGRGLGAQLMHAIERSARDAGFSLLTLDAKRGGVAEGLYRKLGWVCAGTIPNYACDPDGKALHDTVIFYKELGTMGTRSPGDAEAVSA
jgi:GNAT superfamily N-acetyltransferase